MRVVKTDLEAARLKREVRRHLKGLGFTRDAAGKLVPPKLDKAAYRKMHLAQRTVRLEEELEFAQRAWREVGHHFATGAEVNVDSIRVRVEQIRASTWQADLFRLACLLWSVPVSRGYGRRLRFLVWDDSNGKLIGLFALGDPVFNLKARDTAIGWTGKDRVSRLVGVLDAYVLGAVPPYSNLLGGKLIATVIRSKEVAEIFRSRYRHTAGTISGKRKQAQLVAVTTTSALGRSSIYNRLTLAGTKYFRPIGYTTGFGHFHFPERLFGQIRKYLERHNDHYAGNHAYGEGANWRLRTIRRALSKLGLPPALLKHGLKREVFLCDVAANAARVLRGENKRPRYTNLLSVEQIGRLAVARWLKPRSTRDSSYLAVTREDIWARICEKPAESLTTKFSHAQRS
jgi:hypothetical protein